MTDDLEARLGDPAPTATPPQALLDRLTEAALAEHLVDVAWAVTDTPIGPLTLAATDRGLVRIDFGGPESSLPALADRLGRRVLEAPARLDAPRRQLDEYFEGKRHRFDVALDRSLSHGFRLRVLEELSTVPYGRVVSYRDLAMRVGNPKASRAVGTAMATNPIPIVVPCHRVLRTGGALGGYGGGLPTKRWLLHLEGALLTA